MDNFYNISMRSSNENSALKSVRFIVLCLIVFVLSFFLCYNLVKSTQTTEKKVEQLEIETDTLNVIIKEKDEKIESLEKQIKNLNDFINGIGSGQVIDTPESDN